MIAFKLIGVIGALLFFLTALLLLRKSQRLGYKILSLSDLGGLPETATPFNFSLGIFLLLEGLFLTQLFTISQFNSTLSLLPLLLAVGSGIVCSLVTIKINKRVHWIFGRIAFVSMCLGGLIFGFSLLQVNKILGLAQLVLVTTLSLILFSGHLKTGTFPVKHEFAFITGVILFNCLVITLL